MPPTDESKQSEIEREQLVARLRARYVQGTLDEILIPEDAKVDRLMNDLFPRNKGDP